MGDNVEVVLLNVRKDLVDFGAVCSQVRLEQCQGQLCQWARWHGVNESRRREDRRSRARH